MAEGKILATIPRSATEHLQIAINEVSPDNLQLFKEAIEKAIEEFGPIEE